MEIDKIYEEKKLIRKHLIQKRNSIDLEKLSENSHIICEKIQQLDCYKNSNMIFGYIPIRNEVNILPVLRKALFSGKHVALPRCIDSNGNMSFFEISSFDDLAPGAYNIPEPKKGLKEIRPEAGIMLVPGVGFSLDCFRIGYGGGYYDRCVGQCSNIIYLAPAYDFQICEKIPLEDHDKKTDIIVTENRIIYGGHGND